MKHLAEKLRLVWLRVMLPFFPLLRLGLGWPTFPGLLLPSIAGIPKESPREIWGHIRVRRGSDY
jgi:hypothetical protein